jgi:hypothetical protein
MQPEQRAQLFLETPNRVPNGVEWKRDLQAHERDAVYEVANPRKLLQQVCGVSEPEIRQRLGQFGVCARVGALRSDSFADLFPDRTVFNRAHVGVSLAVAAAIAVGVHAGRSLGEGLPGMRPSAEPDCVDDRHQDFNLRPAESLNRSVALMQPKSSEHVQLNIS